MKETYLSGSGEVFAMGQGFATPNTPQKKHRSKTAKHSIKQELRKVLSYRIESIIVGVKEQLELQGISQDYETLSDYIVELLDRIEK